MTSHLIAIAKDDEGNIRISAETQLDMLIVHSMLADALILVSDELKPILDPGPSRSIH